MDEQGVVGVEDTYGAGVYQKFPVVITEGRGAILKDINGKEYVDFMGGYGVGIVGHSNPKIIEAIKIQAEKLITCHGSIYNDVRAELLEKLIKISPKGLDKAYLCNSGTEAVECAIKLARRYTKKTEIIAMMNSYHGKTMGALSATWKLKYRKPFQPLVPEFKFVPFGRADKVTKAISDKTAAVIVEPIQGEGGVYVAPDGYLQELREICDEKNILLIFDEIQTGFGRTGKMWASEHWNTTPDIMCLAKAIAGGVPMGATIAKKEIMSSFKVGDHTSTFGGNPLACAAASATIDFILEEKLPERANVLGKYFMEELRRLQRKFRIAKETRGLGLMLAMELRFQIRNILLKAITRGVIMLYCGMTILRFLPPLVIKKEQIAYAINVLEDLLAEEENEIIGK